MIESGTFLQQRYRIDKQIGQGGMGAVYVATDERFNSMVAIKETLCMDDSFRKAIEREARLLNSLKHSALPRVSDHFVENAGQFLVMEYIQGHDLHEILERDQRPFPVEMVLLWADQLLDALDYLHTQADPVIHRDIKPQNLKITSRGQVILLDFGLAKGNPTDGGHNTAAKSIFGYSRNYASLEQIQGTGTDPRSDLYSLAATLYHLMTNTAPEDALTRAMSVLSQNGDPLRPANSIDPSIPAGVAGVLHKALSLNAADRPSSAAEMRQMLRETEKYEHLTKASPVPATTGEHVFGQPTRLMSEETRASAANNQTDVKTEIFPGSISQATSVNDPGEAQKTSVAQGLTSAAVPRRRRFGMAAAALPLLLAGGAVAGGIYLINPSVFGISMTEKAADPNASVPPVNDLPEQTTDTGQVQSGSADGSAEVNATQTERQTAGKQAETAKTGKASPVEKSKTSVTNPDDSEVTVNDGDVPESVVITRRDRNGKVTTMRVNPNIRPPDIPEVPSDQYGPFPPGFDPSRPMTPAERMKLRRWRQRHNANLQP
jgi:serine/threonine protein kinase